MKRISFLLILFPLVVFACDDRPHSNSTSPLWLKYLKKAAKKKPYDYDKSSKVITAKKQEEDKKIKK